MRNLFSSSPRAVLTALALSLATGAAAQAQAPTITSFSPTSSSTYNIWVYIQGTNLNGGTVRFNGTLSSRFDSYGTYGYALLPSGATTGRITVTTAYGTATSATNFVVNATPPPSAPSISSFSPASGAVGASVTISGANFTGTTAVRFNGVNATFTVNSASSITATVPSGATSGAITVVTPNGTATSSSNFTVQTTNPSAPTITSFSPTSSSTYNVWIYIQGTNLTNGTVKFNGTPSTNVVWYASTYGYAMLPTGATTGPITVTTANGTATSATNFVVGATPPPSAPSISSFSPTSGGVGTSVTISGANFTGATAVRFNGVNATFTVNSASQITTSVPTGASTGAITVVTPNGTATSATNFTVNTTPPPAAPSISSFTPTSGSAGASVTINGANFTGATAVRFNGASATYTVNASNRITATVPASATTGPISVTTSGGTATSSSSFTVSGGTGTVDYYPSKVLVGQATQNTNGTMRMAQDKRGWVQVYMVANASNTLKPAVRIQCLVNGTQVYETTVAAPTANAGVPTTAPAYGNFTNTYVANIPATAFKPGMSVVATADPTNAVPDSNRANNSRTATVDVRNTYPFRVTMVPLQIYYGGYYTGAVTTSNVSQFMDMFQRIWPVPEAYSALVHSVYYTTTIPYADYSSGWETVLNELGALQRAEGATNRYYYGVYKPYYGTAGGSGMAWLGYPQAMGVDWDNLSSTFSWKAGTVAHEIGHSLNLNHAPCGGAGGPDPYYPYSGGTLGTYGRDAWAGTVYAPNSYYDVMGYCGYSWVSDYNVNKVMDFRLSGDSTVPGPVPGPMADPALMAAKTKVKTKLIFGTIVNGEVKMSPAFDIEAVPDEPRADGSYGVELTGANGQVIGSTRFEPAATGHGNPNIKGFVMAVPVDEASAAAPAAGALAAASGGSHSIRIHRNGETLAVAKGRPAALAAVAPGAKVQPEVQALRLPGGRVRVISPDAAGMMVKNEKGEVITIAYNGDVSVPTDAKRLTVLVSDGAGSRTLTVDVQ